LEAQNRTIKKLEKSKLQLNLKTNIRHDDGAGWVSLYLASPPNPVEDRNFTLRPALTETGFPTRPSPNPTSENYSKFFFLFTVTKRDNNKSF